MSLLDRWRKAVKTKSKTLLNAPATTHPTESSKYSYENSLYKGSTTSLQHSEDNGRSRKKSENEKQNDSGKELKRSETFTLKDGPPDDVFYEAGSTDYTNYGTYKKEKNAVVQTDVFETLYTKRPSKSSRSSRSSSGSFNGYTIDQSPVVRTSQLSRTPSVPATPPIISSPPSISNRINYFSRNSVAPSENSQARTSRSVSRQPTTISPPTYFSRHSGLVTPTALTNLPKPRTTTVINVNIPSTQSSATPRTAPVSVKPQPSISTKPREYLFGTIERPATKKKEINKENNEADDRFKTITLKDVRRSFRDKYMKNDNRAETQHQPLWFVDVNDKQPSKPQEHSDEDSLPDRDSGYTRSMYMEFDPPKRRNAVSRKDTFKVIRNDSNYIEEEEYQRRPATGSSSLRRRETFKVDDPIQVRFVSTESKPISAQERNRRNLEAIRVDLNAVSDHRTKMVPIGIATRYSSLKDNDDNSYGGRKRYSSRHRDEQTTDEPDGRYVFGQTMTKKKSSDRGTWTRNPHDHSSSVRKENRSSDILETIKKPIDSLRSRWDFSLRKHEPVREKQYRDQSAPNLGFDKFYDPNYIMPKNQNTVYGPMSPSYRAVNLKVLPKPRETSIRSNSNNWIYNQVHI